MEIQQLVNEYQEIRATKLSLERTAEHRIDWLKRALQAAITLEYATCPPYLCALWSIENDLDPVAVSLREVGQEEMVHLALVCNMLSAIGGEPSFTVPPADSPDNLPLPARIAYPSHLPGGVRPSLIVPLEGLNPSSIEVFMEIESPEFPGQYEEFESTGDHYCTIGEFYDAILDAFDDNEDVIEFTTEFQITGPRANFVVKDIHDARKAIDLIKNQGEGSIAPVDLGDGVYLGAPTWEFAPGENYLAHYYRFWEMKERKKIRTWTEDHDGHTVTKYEFDEPFEFPKTFPMAAVPAGGYQADDVTSEVAYLLERFDVTYTRLLNLFEGAWRQGGQASFWHAIETMFDLAETGRKLMQIEIPGGEGTYGPCFRYLE